MTHQPLYESILSAQSAVSESKIRASASVVPWRLTDSGKVQVYWVRRSRTMPFMGGWYAFPGGGLSRKDAGARLHGEPNGCPEGQITKPIADPRPESLSELSPDLVPGLAACALRELFEETGILPTSSPIDLSPEELAGYRERLLAKEITFEDMAEQGSWRPDAAPLVFAGRWLTPPFAPMRFDNRFFLLHWGADEPIQPTMMGRELDLGEWLEPAAAYDRWLAGEVLAAPPILHILKVLAEHGPDRGLGRLRSTEAANFGPLRRIEFRPGIVLFPLRTPTLPPATHTNAFLLGRGEAVLVDPATPFEDEQQRLLEALDAARDQGYSIREIWLTHHHSDHVGAVEAVRRHLDIPVLAHAETGRLLASRGISIDGELFDGQRVVLDGAPPLSLTVHHTPGHAPGHLCFFDDTFRTLIAGDLISTLSTIVIDPPEGNMHDYLESLERMAALDARIVFPSHGPGTLDHPDKMDEYRSHRLEREAMVLEAHRSGKTTPSAMVAEVYADVPPFVHPIAMRQIQAHLDRLQALGEI